MKKSQFRSGLDDTVLGEKGQALIEYILILVVTVSLVMLLMNYMFKPFGAFVKSYMGDYVGCLLEYGELPSLGGDDSIVDEDSECSKRFQPATLANGRPLRDGNSGQGDRDPAGRGQNSNNQANQSGGDGGGGGSSSSGGSGSNYAGSSSRGRSSRVNFGRRPSSGVESSASPVADGKVIEVTLGQGEGGGGFFRSSNRTTTRVRRNKVRAVGIAGLTEAERKTLEKKAEGTAKTLTVTQGVETPPKKLTVKPPEQRSVASDEDESFTVGGFMRYLFIAALIIALVIFLGGQALQLSKEL